jgi:hypothetical protein
MTKNVSGNDANSPLRDPLGHRPATDNGTFHFRPQDAGHRAGSVKMSVASHAPNCGADIYSLFRKFVML